MERERSSRREPHSMTSYYMSKDSHGAAESARQFGSKLWLIHKSHQMNQEEVVDSKEMS